MNTKALKCAALLCAFSLLVVQIIATIEHTEGSSYYSKASLIVALCCLAIVPILAIEAARAGQTATSFALFMTVICLLAYTLPVTVGRSAEARQQKHLSKVAHHEQISTQKVIRSKVVAECASGDGPKCRGLRSAYTSLAESEAPQTGDLGTEVLAWALFLSEDTLRKISALAVAIGYDLGICALAAFAGSIRTREKESEAGTAPPSPSADVAEVKPAGPSLAEKWMAEFLRENPRASADKAHEAYEAAMAGRGGRRMSKESFRRRFRMVAA